MGATSRRGSIQDDDADADAPTASNKGVIFSWSMACRCVWKLDDGNQVGSVTAKHSPQFCRNHVPHFTNPRCIHSTKGNKVVATRKPTPEDSCNEHSRELFNVHVQAQSSGSQH
eukprot:4544978-Amphidinium_carterae.1